MKDDRVRVLVPLERDESGIEPARLLEALFSPTAARVRGLHVAPVAVPHFYLPAGLDLDSLRREQLVWEEDARRILERQVDPLRDAGFAVETEVTAGSPIADIRKRARLWHGDLILARPRRGRNAAGRLGGVATGLIQTAPAPVLLYRRVPSGYRVGTILAPVDFSPFSREAIGWALLFASLAGSRVRLLHVLPAASALRPWNRDRSGDRRAKGRGPGGAGGSEGGRVARRPGSLRQDRAGRGSRERHSARGSPLSVSRAGHSDDEPRFRP